MHALRIPAVRPARRRTCLATLAALGLLACASGGATEPGAGSRAENRSERPEAAARAPSTGDYAAHMAKLQRKLTPGMTARIHPPFVVIGDEPAATVERRARRIVQRTASALRKDFFDRDPGIIDIWMFGDALSYATHTERLHGRPPFTPYGFYVAEERAIYTNIATGGGTLIHEIVHPYMEANFPDCPAWYNEGLGSLFEAVSIHEGSLYGRLNWRLAGLRESIEAGTLPTLARIVATSEEEFYADDTGNHYAAARYLLYYLQERKHLRRFHRELLAGHDRDPSGRATLERVLGQDLPSFEPRFRRWVLSLPSGS
ncbi:MAG: hypothetical protein OXT09_24170 [Myxococcales bacterium]|nr:hypothetical protein [Myxococcales bacterium]